MVAKPGLNVVTSIIVQDSTADMAVALSSCERLLNLLTVLSVRGVQFPCKTKFRYHMCIKNYLLMIGRLVTISKFITFDLKKAF
jgi:hypothetical protein